MKHTVAFTHILGTKLTLNFEVEADAELGPLLERRVSGSVAHVTNTVARITGDRDTFQQEHGADVDVDTQTVTVNIEPEQQEDWPEGLLEVRLFFSPPVDPPEPGSEEEPEPPALTYDPSQTVASEKFILRTYR